MQRITLAVLGAALLSVSAAAQTAAPTTSRTAATAPMTTPPVDASEAEVKPAGTAPAANDVETTAQGFTYTADGRRDPFVALLRGSGSAVLATTETVRASGLAGLDTAEVTLRGVLMSQGGYVAMVKGNDEKTYIVRAGDRLADGTIRAITSRMLVIAQQVKEPLSRISEREVRKMLRQPAEGTN